MSNNHEWNIPAITTLIGRHPKLETDEENWDDSQFDDAEFLYNHNSTEESNRIHREYSAYFEKVRDQEYSPYHTAQGVEYHIPNQIITMPIHN